MLPGTISLWYISNYSPWHSITSHKTWIFSNTAVWTSDLLPIPSAWQASESIVGSLLWCSLMTKQSWQATLTFKIPAFTYKRMHVKKIPLKLISYIQTTKKFTAFLRQTAQSLFLFATKYNLFIYLFHYFILFCSNNTFYIKHVLIFK